MSLNLEFNWKLIQTIERILPAKSDQVELVSDVISLGKEAAYRRLRGDVLFSFEDACGLANRLGFSLDDISQAMFADDFASFELQCLIPDEIEDHCDYYYKYAIYGHETFELMKDDPSLLTMSAFCSIPQSMLFEFPSLFRFRAFQWIFQVSKSSSPIRFSNVCPSANVVERLNKLSSAFSLRHEQIVIFDRHVFSALGEEILHFYELQLISVEEKEDLKNELLVLINLTESIARQGKTDSDKYFWLFKSNIDFETNYIYLKGNGFETSVINIYQMNVVSSSDPNICTMHRQWIESLRKYSTLISISGEKERNLFFEQQREYINQLL